jgi:hypothetical protein
VPLKGTRGYDVPRVRVEIRTRRGNVGERIYHMGSIYEVLDAGI